ncbi:MAG TPA: SPOR domain-containing protein [Burkholderiaceae bacterium]|nr:SPOR domain-containing protein [Burkholderiaceae bacterium]
MGLLSIFKRRADAPSPAGTAAETADAVLQARTRARQRLIGAAVLVVIGIIGFPLVFETQPRPIPVDIPIELPRKDGAVPLVMPPARAPGTTSTASAVSAARPAAPAPAPATGEIITESREDAGRAVNAASAPVAAVTPAPAKPDAAPAAKPATVAATEAPPKPAESKPAPAVDGARARALLEGKPGAAAAESGRFVVQVGAFADANAAHETRLKVEKLGLKTYTQVASTAAGNRIRVRVGPFGTRDEADKAMAKARGAGLSAVVLTL